MSSRKRRNNRERAGIIFLNSEVPNLGLVRRILPLCSVHLCSDGGLSRALGFGIEPDFVVGDMDSVPRPLPALRRAIFRCDFDESLSDFEKTLRLASELGLRRLYVAGALGGRLDHVLVNRTIAEAWAGEFDMVLVDQGLARLLRPGSYAFKLPRGAIFSLLAAGAASRVSLSGCRYPLKNAVLEPGSRGLSNAAKGPAAVRLRLHDGLMWFIQPLAARI
ncbi:MAG: thiamine diphosphokinase [Elusimicrobia bacterium]|nr:thiamine diphosphokinase [Elusimicrobiota bacterium]